MDPVDPFVQSDRSVPGGNKPTWPVLTRYLIGEATPGEAADVERWAATHAGGVSVIATLRHWWTPRPQPADASHVENALSAVLKRATGVPGLSVPQPERSDSLLPAEDRSRAVDNVGRRAHGASGMRSAQRRWYTLAGVAAGAALVIAGWALVGNGVFRRGARPEGAYTTYATTNGQRANITLPDGSTVMLNVASRLEVPTNYGAGNHTVRLPVGEALFTVSHHAGRSFAVMTGATMVRVLGTSFVVRHYGTDMATTVAVRTGKVEVRSVVLTAAQQVAIGPTGLGAIRAVDPSQYSFASGVLTLKGASLTDAIPQLDRWYDADIRLGDPSLAHQHLTGEYTAGSLGDLTSILELTFNVRVVRNGRVLTLFPR